MAVVAIRRLVNRRRPFGEPETKAPVRLGRRMAADPTRAAKSAADVPGVEGGDPGLADDRKSRVWQRPWARGLSSV